MLFFPYKLPLNKNAKAFCLYCTKSYETNSYLREDHSMGHRYTGKTNSHNPTAQVYVYFYSYPVCVFRALVGFNPKMLSHRWCWINPVMHLASTQYVPVGTSSEINHWEGLCSVLYIQICLKLWCQDTVRSWICTLRHKYSACFCARTTVSNGTVWSDGCSTRNAGIHLCYPTLLCFSSCCDAGVQRNDSCLL